MLSPHEAAGNQSRQKGRRADLDEQRLVGHLVEPGWWLGASARGELAHRSLGVRADLFQTLTIDRRMRNIVEPSVAEPSDAAQSRFDIVRRQQDRNAARLQRFGLDRYVLEPAECALVRNIIFLPSRFSS